MIAALIRIIFNGFQAAQIIILRIREKSWQLNVFPMLSLSVCHQRYISICKVELLSFEVVH